LLTATESTVVLPATSVLGVKDFATCKGVSTVVRSLTLLLPARLGASPPPATLAMLLLVAAVAPTLNVMVMGG
jgi:hypothetical protein